MRSALSLAQGTTLTCSPLCSQGSFARGRVSEYHARTKQAGTCCAMVKSRSTSALTSGKARSGHRQLRSWFVCKAQRYLFHLISLCNLTSVRQQYFVISFSLQLLTLLLLPIYPRQVPLLAPTIGNCKGTNSRYMLKGAGI